MLLIFMASVLARSAADFSLVIPGAPVSAPLGSSVILPCDLSPALNARTFEVHWYKNFLHKNLVLLYKDQKVQENFGEDQYRNRVSLTGEMDKGTVSLKLDNLTLADGGEYFCFVTSISWYEKGSMTLVVKALGSTPVLLLQEVGEQMNVTCTSGGWSPKPMLTWRDSAGQELPNSHTYYRTDSEGLVSVSSWLLFSSSDWISCTVGLNHEEIRESRVVPVRGFWREAFISTLVLSLIILTTFTVLLILFRKGFLPHCSSHKNAKAADSHEVLQTETLPLNATEKTDRVISSSCESTEGPFSNRFEVTKLTLDPSTAHESLNVSSDCRSVFCKHKSKDSKFKFPHVVSKEELGSGEFYWEVKIWDKGLLRQKLSWCLGVTQKPESETRIRALWYEGGGKARAYNGEFKEVTIDKNMTKIGLLLNCEKKILSFFNADKNSNNFFCAFNNLPHGTYYALFSPGVKDTIPLKLHLINSKKQSAQQ
ncbi:butyrophilin subfamily 2 member A2-like isoform X2 [Tachysurus vachellii]|uniref:butyrophilin subfamily 2 member A2-like isoform X2 n=1 Tax=Tachysurus vachellii TaxID=175792 RepID=UPI00296AC19D|nr:butyrophilin subfamily 2 member A2-like isoform X2 [Tachysurus vachellii]